MISSSLNSCVINGGFTLKFYFMLASHGAEDTLKQIFGSLLQSPPEDHCDVTVQMIDDIKYKSWSATLRSLISPRFQLTRLI